MNRPQVRIILLALIAGTLTLGAIFYFDSGQEEAYDLVNVGGSKNKCACTQRIER